MLYLFIFDKGLVSSFELSALLLILAEVIIS